MTTITVIAHEEGYPDILIYTVEVSNALNRDEVELAVHIQRNLDLAPAEANKMHVLFAFAGDVSPCADWRE